MKKLLLVVFLLSSFSLFSQSNIGFNLNFNDETFQINSLTVSEGTNIYSVNEETIDFINSYTETYIIPQHDKLYDLYLQIKTNPMINQNMVNSYYPDFVESYQGLFIKGPN